MLAQVLRPPKPSTWMLVPVGVLAAFVLFLLAFDQGHLLSMVQGQAAYANNFIHELVHDARHAGGFPCH